jgi:hypothetical protein
MNEKRSLRLSRDFVAVLAVGAWFASGAVWHAAAQSGEPTSQHPQASSQTPYGDKCPPKSPSGGGIVEMRITFAVSNPKPDVTCSYSDGPGPHFQVEKGCDVEPTSVIADGKTMGWHACRESEPGAGNCKIVCPNR